ncbi:MAG: hypothetical protein HN368_01560 [Spirochaetales bacterium]|jgi:transaldolase|nr:hypothetical protein [Spirochaetales bacterium]
MKIYGAGSLEEIKKCINLGAIGILTNPQGFEQYFKGEMTLEEISKAILEVADLPIFIQIHGRTAAAIAARARELHTLSKNIGFKIISDEKGFEAINTLQKEGIRCIATTLFTVSQAAVAASVGAFGICPFVSRAAASGMDPAGTLSAIRQAYDRLPYAPEIIAVSLKSTADVELAIKAGVDAVGMRYPLLKEMMYHPLSEKAEALFAVNWAGVKGEDVSYIGDAPADGIAE